MDFTGYCFNFGMHEFAWLGFGTSGILVGAYTVRLCGLGLRV